MDGYVNLYYRAFIYSKYKESEKVMKKIILDNVIPIDDNKKTESLTYYKDKKNIKSYYGEPPKTHGGSS